MRLFNIAAIGLAFLALSGCNRGLTGTYSCTGTLPDITTLTLNADGSYNSTGSIDTHTTAGLGKYQADPAHVTLRGTYTVEGLTQVEPNLVIFDREKGGILKSLMTTCRK